MAENLKDSAIELFDTWLTLVAMRTGKREHRFGHIQFLDSVPSGEIPNVAQLTGPSPRELTLDDLNELKSFCLDKGVSNYFKESHIVEQDCRNPRLRQDSTHNGLEI